MVEGRIQGIKAAGESKVERPCRGTGAQEEGWRNTLLSAMFFLSGNEGIKTFLKNTKFMFRHVSSRALGSYAPVSNLCTNTY